MTEAESNILTIINTSSEDDYSEDILKPSISKRYTIRYKDVDLLFTLKQIEIISLIAKGFSNSKIARNCKVREPSIKLMVYRLMKYLEDATNDKIDRFYLIILCQGIIKAGAETYKNLEVDNTN